MDQVRFELTTSRSIGEVTLSFTTFSIQSYKTTLKPAILLQVRAGRKIEQSRGATAPLRVTDEVSLHCAIPASVLWRESATQDFCSDALQLSYNDFPRGPSLVGIEPTTSGLVEVTQAFTTPQTRFSCLTFLRLVSFFVLRAHP